MFSIRKPRSPDTASLLEAAVRGMTDAFALWDKDDRLVMCNENYRRMFGSAGSVLEPGISFEETMRIYVERESGPWMEIDRDAWLAWRIDQHKNPQGPFEAARSTGWFRFQEEKLPDGSIVAIVADITRMRDREARLERVTREIERAHQELERRVAERTRELDAANQRLQREIDEQRRVQSQLGAAEARFRGLVEQSLAAIYIIQDGKFAYVNPKFAEVFAYAVEEVVGRLSPIDLTAPEDRPRVIENIRRRTNGETDAVHYSFTGIKKDGGRIVVEVQGRAAVHDGRPAIVGVLVDITQRIKAEQELQLAASVFENTMEAIVVTDIEANILSVNPAFVQISGYEADEVIGKNVRLLKSEHHDAPFYRALWHELKETGQWQGEIWNRRKSGEVYLEWKSIGTVRDALGNPVRYVAVSNDITELRRKDERIKHQAYHDALTGLPNRLLLMDRLDHALASARREDSQVAVMFLDLDRFKLVNDSLGHEVGDLLLQEAADRLSACVRKSDTVSRLGGDEFVILLTDFGPPTEIAHMASRIVAQLVEPMNLHGHEVHVTASIGIAVHPQDGVDTRTLLKNADVAMYQAKAGGRNNFRFFDASMNSRAVERLDLEAQLRRAVQREEFELHYQPKVCLGDERFCGVEALIRWKHPERGLVYPNDFIGLAEETGLIRPMGEWAMREACRQARLWLDSGQALEHVAVNVSARQFQDENLVRRVVEILAETGLPPKFLEIELTESTVMNNPDEAIRVLRELREMGIMISVDDFGTGYSSLSYLKKLPISTLKIDRSFVTDIGSNSDDEAIVETIIALGKSLDLRLVAEGVETSDQADFLAAKGCDFAQGYFFAKPLPPGRFGEWLAENLRRPDPAFAAKGEGI